MGYKKLFFLFCFLAIAAAGCNNKKSSANTAFYYWKTVFTLDAHQRELLDQAAGKRLYLRFFDVVWDENKKEVIPNGRIKISDDLNGVAVTPVVYVTNRTFEKLRPDETDSLAIKVNTLLSSIAAKHHILYTAVQIDCDWTIGTKDRYFAFLKAFKKISNRQMEVTIRLHQVKYAERTGVPPADKGLLMFYNMGTVSANVAQENSIYNANDAGRYLGMLPHYKLPLDIALPVFSWAIHIRNGRVIQLYNQIGVEQLGNKQQFSLERPGVYRALHSFYLSGIYVKENDLFKLEEMNADNLNAAAAQLSTHLPKLEKRNIIYYELSSKSASKLEAKDFGQVSAHF